MTLAAIPSPSTAVWHFLGLPIRAYALCIVLGIVVACLVTEFRLRRRGVAPWAVLDMAVWAVPFGIVGARLYHVITSPQGYFGDGGTPIKALYIWEGGLGIWGGVLGGALGAWLAARQLGLPLSVFADALAPGLPLAQAVGRFGNWFNNELYGKVTTLPWGLQVHDMDREHPGQATVIDGKPVVLPDLYHPTFLYESLWDVGVAVVVFLADRRYRFGRGRAFALYVMAYTVGRFWIELLRTDEANHFFGIRLNVFTSVLVFLGALAYFLLVKGPRGYVVPIDAPDSAEALADVTATAAAADDVSTGGTRTPPVAPAAYQVVSEERFEAYRRTGILPPPTIEESTPTLPTAPVPARASAPGQLVGSGPTADAAPAAGSEPATTPEFVTTTELPAAAEPDSAAPVESAAESGSQGEAETGSTVATAPADTAAEPAATAAVAETVPTTSDDAAKPDAAKPGVVEPGVVEPGVVKPGVVKPGVARSSAAQSGAAPVGTPEAVLAEPEAVEPEADATTPDDADIAAGSPAAARDTPSKADAPPSVQPATTSARSADEH